MSVGAAEERSPAAVVASLVVAAAIASLVVAAAEWGILLATARDRFAGAAQIAGLLPILAGNLVPYAIGVATVLTIGDRLVVALRSRLRHPRIFVTLGAGALAVPYAIPVARFAFSGPRAHAMAHRPVLEIAFGAVVALSFAGLMGAALLRADSRRMHGIALAGATSAVTASAWLGRNVLASEYELLHQLLAIWCLVIATLAGRDLARTTLVRVRRRASRILLVATAVTVVGWLAAVMVLARAHGQAWLVWRETGTSRYLTRRFTSLAPRRAVVSDGPRMVLRPRVEERGSSAAREERAAGPAPNIVVFSIDGLRRDHVGAYGFTRHPTTPNLDRFAQRGVVFDNAVSSYPATQVFNSSLLLGRWVGKLEGDQQPRRFRADAVTQLLHRRGYRSFVKSWLEHSSRNKVKPEVFAIDTYVRKSDDKADLEGPMEETLAPLRTHLAAADAAHQPVFVWMHLLGTHPVPGGDFEPDPSFPFGDARMQRYASAIAGSDAWLPHVERMMDERKDDSRPTIWILCSDHGTNAATASRDLYDGVARVPLVVVGPGIEHRRDGALVDTAVDLAATIVDLAGIAPPDGYDGVSLVPLLAGETPPDLPARIVPLAYNKLSGAVFGDFKLIEDGTSVALFDRRSDPAELRNLVDQRPDLAAQMSTVAGSELARRRRVTLEARR